MKKTERRLYQETIQSSDSAIKITYHSGVERTEAESVIQTSTSASKEIDW